MAELRTHNKGGTRVYLSILADGKIHQTVPECTEGGVWREWEDSKTKAMQRKYEIVHDSIFGTITAIRTESTEYGDMVKVELDHTHILTLNTASRFFDSFAKKLPNADISKPVNIVPYSFAAKDAKGNVIEGKKVQGLNIMLGDTKAQDYYWDASEKKSLNGMPEPEGDTKSYSKSNWKLYFMRVQDFLVKSLPIFETPKGSINENDFDQYFDEPTIYVPEDEHPTQPESQDAITTMNELNSVPF